MSVTGMKPADIVKLLNTDDGSVIFKLIPAEIPSVVECDSPRYVRALVSYFLKFFCLSLQRLSSYLGK